jgi:peptidoglycan L-alanyl-D-glutamate endopeptidase CwlK
VGKIEGNFLMSFVLGSRSRARLKGVHPDLVRVVELALTYSPHDFTITEGLRSVARQRELKAAGASQTMNSRHITGHAIDFAVLVGGKVRWDWPLYGQVAVAFKRAAKELNVPIIWGGDWKSLRDGPHIELQRQKYP